ncbi:MAG: type II toxin-antitoxin system RelE/ParE family toxin [Prevotellaceae bacterium]|jgi:phage-related protein|nr:type II toxin-antitoxin system RelE/ParE family toxin [Prevotellaceae bacterium]
MNKAKRFDVVYSPPAADFLERIDAKARDKIVYNIDRASYALEPELFKKLTGTDLWEFRTLYSGKQYRLLAFWDRVGDRDTLVIATHGFIKKADKTPMKEIERANAIMQAYYKSKNQ